MSWKGLTISAACLLIAGVAMAEKVPTIGQPAPPMAATSCDLADYKEYRQLFDPPQVVVNDGDTASGQIDIADDGTTFADIIVDLDITHSWMGDLQMLVSYDRECDGQAEGSAYVMNQPGLPQVSATFGCSDNLDGMYLFADKAGIASLNDDCIGDTANTFPGGCYVSRELLGVFDGEAKGGCFTMLITDNANGDTGDVRGWSIHALNGPPNVPTEEKSWSQIKAIY